jgi:hypothetical protein
MTTMSVRLSGDVRPAKALHVGLWVVQGLLGAMFLAVGALGLILPAATRVKPVLTPLAGVGLAMVMLLATIFHISRGELGAVPMPLALGGLAAFVAWGCTARAPIAAR